MASQTNNFTRSNVNAATLQITDPGRSSFNLGHKNELSIPFGKIVPVSTKILLPTDTFTGSLKPNFHLEKIATPSIGATRLDTHTFVVNFRRINKDMRKSLENGTNFFPSFSYYLLFDNYTGSLLSNKTFPNLSSWIGEHLSNATSFKKLAIDLTYNIFTYLSAFLIAFKNSNIKHFYQLDKVIFLVNYYKELSEQAKKITLTDNDPLIFFQFLLPSIYKPFIGPSSLVDYLGYPCFSQYNRCVSSLTSLPKNDNQFFTDFKSSYSTSLLFGILSNSLQVSYDVNSKKYLFTTEDYTSSYSELPLRAYYAVWYDYLRNWHIEERSLILDPDEFNSNLVVPNVPVTTNDTAFFLTIAKFLSFYTLRARDYGTDFLTSIQTDDAFRHVYSPVFSLNSSGNSYSGSVTEEDAAITPSTINGLSIEEFGLFNIPSDSTGSNNVLNFQFAQDLQTMRRSGMLERWLARNYYYPDTYVGRLQARFGVRPSDYEILVSQYIGGSESFISGQELVANMSTSESVVGSRSLKADVSTTDTFSGSVSDYSILISVVSTVPIVSYDVISPAAKIIDFVDFPQPEFATDTRVAARTSDFLRGFSIKPFIGYVPRYYLFRVSADESHGRYLTDYRIYNWLRDNYSMSQENFDFSLNPYSLRVNLPLNAFIGLQPWDDFAYGSCDLNLVVNRALPAAIEII